MEVSGHEEGEIAIPINMSSSGGGGTYDHDHDGNSASQHHSHMMMMGWEEKKEKEKEKVRYRECLKNHAAAMGGNARDGCGEFMPSGEEGTMEALNCSACHCHRNFHRRDDMHMHMHMLLHPFHYPLISSSSPHPHLYDDGRSRKWAQQKPSMVAEKKNKRKRFRTKFTEEQKEKMLGFAEKVGWKIQKQEEAVVHHFCQDIGVKRRVLKVWMHNNKHNHRRPTPTHNNNNPPPPPTA